MAMGCNDMVIVASGDGILVSNKERSGYMKSYVERIHRDAMYAEKSWGTYTVIDVQEGSMTVKVSIRAGEQMTYHSHDYRSEVWTVVSGEGIAVVDGMEQLLRPGDVITIAAGCKHIVKAISDLDIIEVQLGDIIAADDKYKHRLEMDLTGCSFSVYVNSFQVILCLDGDGQIEIADKPGKSLRFRKGECMFLPAGLGRCFVLGDTTLLKIRC